MEKIYEKISELSNKNPIEKILGARIAAARGKYFQICEKEKFFIDEEILPYFFEKETIKKLADKFIAHAQQNWNKRKKFYYNKILRCDFFDFIKNKLAEFGIKMDGEFRAECKKIYDWPNMFFEDAFVEEIAKCIFFKINGTKYPEEINLRKDGSDFF